MKFFRLDLLTLLISLFILTGCKNQDSLGLGVNSTNQINGSLVDTSTIIINTVKDDAIITSGPLAKTPLGFFNDPLFGTTEADVATDINLPSQSAYSLPSGTITVDSASLILHWADGFYGDSLPPNKFKINVYQLQKKFRTDTSYSNTKYFGTYSSSPLLGTRTISSKTHDSVQIYNKVAGTAKTLIKVGPEVRIPISTDFINRSFFNAGSLALGSNSIFQTTLRGLYITLDKIGTTGPGGIFMIAPTDTLAIFYKATNGTTVDTTAVYLPIAHLAANISHTYSATIQNELSNKTPGSVFYLQGLGGLKAKVSFPNLLMNLRKSLLNAGNDIVLNRAELVITTIPNSGIPYVPAPKLTMYRLDIANQRSYVQDASPTDPRSGGVGVFGGFYSTANQQYHFIITAYLQDLLINKAVDYGTYIAPVDTTNKSSVDIGTNSSGFISQVAARAAAVGSNSSSPYRIKLNIIYTIIKKSQ